MKNKIYLNTIILAFCSVVLSSSLLIVTFYSSLTQQVKSEIKSKAAFLERVLNTAPSQAEYINELNLSNTELRITLVESEGKVLYDNGANATELENHGDRIEIIEAVQDGIGEEKRVSETLGKETYYYALRLSNGNILRVAKTSASIYGIFISILPQSIIIIILILFFCLYIAKSLTKKIIDPINKIDFNSKIETYDELAPFVKTITSQKQQIEDALVQISKKNALLDTVTHSMNEGLILTDKDGNVLSANKSILHVLNIKGNPVGKNILEIIRNVSVLERMREVLSGSDNNIVLDISEKTYHIFFSSVDNGALILFLDVTEKARSEKMRHEFTANVTHELKTPLTTIFGFAELMANGLVKPEDIVGVAEMVKKESDRLISLIEDIMRLSEIDEEQEKSFERFDLTVIINEVYDNLKPKAEALAVTVDIPTNENIITANKQMMFELLYNLIENAIKYNKQGGKVSVAAFAENGKAHITVSDTGIGIDKIHYDRIFERFYRVDKSRSKKIEGTGLGLSIVKHIAAYHNGRVEIVSELDKGTEIKVELSQPENIER